MRGAAGGVAWDGIAHPYFKVLRYAQCTFECEVSLEVSVRFTSCLLLSDSRSKAEMTCGGINWIEIWKVCWINGAFNFACCVGRINGAMLLQVTVNLLHLFLF